MQDAVAPPEALNELVGEPVEVALIGHVELEHRCRLRQPPGYPRRDAEASPEAREHNGCALLLRESGDREGDRGLREHTRDEQALALNDSWHGRPSFQWPIPRPPSTGMTAPVT